MNLKDDAQKIQILKTEYNKTILEVNYYPILSYSKFEPTGQGKFSICDWVCRIIPVVCMTLHLDESPFYYFVTKNSN